MINSESNVENMEKLLNRQKAWLHGEGYRARKLLCR